MDWNAVLELVVTVVFLAGIALALLCLVTIHRNPYFSEVQKLKWLLLVLCLPYVGPVTWLLRARLECIDRERAEHERTARGSATASSATASGAISSDAAASGGVSDSASEALPEPSTTSK
ncbi:PLDc N-terminal domain-containing protein [Rothia mucilaginosa]|uniref:PLDc N-terminal domain-containing protein n=1 Tax=Rothia mucilaginosa TaxID=43675 RepID=UPI0028D12394|nr:PLDc N-terminal domain-containing protein [Rothia mucilaginosa]